MLFSESIVAQIIIGHGIERWNIVSTPSAYNQCNHNKSYYLMLGSHCVEILNKFYQCL